MYGFRFLVPLALLHAAGCGNSSNSGDADAQVETLTAVSYCETIEPFFCDFYLRCGRMDVPNAEACQSAFLESCNAKYEGAYIELEQLGFMSLSPEGLAACESHLASVACEQQVFELTGPCADIWAGQQTVGESCGLDSEFFACDANSECVLGLDFCGTCRERIAIGSPCIPGEQTCGAAGFCQDGLCAARKANGEVCGDADRCMAGAVCTGGVCTGPQFVGPGDSCDREHRCPYLTECISGRCEDAVMQGDACDAVTTCATGFCQDGVCVAPQANGSACTGASQCRSLLCSDGLCQARPSACMQ